MKDVVNSVMNQVQFNSIISRVMEERSKQLSDNNSWKEKVILLKNGVAIKYQQHVISGDAKFKCSQCEKEILLSHNELFKLERNIENGNDIVGVFCSESCERTFRKKQECATLETISPTRVNIQTGGNTSVPQVPPTIQPATSIQKKVTAPKPIQKAPTSEPMVQLGECIQEELEQSQQFPCLNCSKPVTLRGESLDNFLRSKKPGPFCCAKCQKKWKKTHKNIKTKSQLPIERQFPPQNIQHDELEKMDIFKNRNNEPGTPVVSLNDAFEKIAPRIQLQKIQPTTPKQEKPIVHTPLQELDPHLRICPECGKPFHMTDSQLKRRKRTELMNPNAAGPFCSRSCSIKYTSKMK